MQSNLKSRLLTENTFILLFSFIVLWGLGFHILLFFPLDLSPDIQTYLAIAQLDFDQSPVRRYRVIIPLLAYLLDAVFGRLIDVFHPWSFEGDFSLCFSFLLINVSIMSIVMWMIYKLCKCFQLNSVVCFIVVIAICTSRWSVEVSGLPLVDSLYIACLVSAILGLVTNNWKYLMVSVWLGPWAKEAYIFVAPVIFMFAGSQKWNLGIHIILSGVVVFMFRYMFDSTLGNDIFHSIKEDFSAFSSIEISLKRLFSFHGMYDVFSVLGFWILLPLYTFSRYFKKCIHAINSHLKLFIVFSMSVLLQALLSTDISRMLYLNIPILAVCLGISLQILKDTLESNQNQEPSI